MRLLIHHLDTYTGSTRAGKQLMENWKIDEIWFGRRDSGFISKYTADNKNCKEWKINTSYTSRLGTYIKIQIIVFTRLLFYAKKYDEIVINSLTPISALVYSIIARGGSKYILWIHEEKLTNRILDRLVKILLKYYSGTIFYCSNYLSEVYNRPGLVLSPYPDNEFRLHSKVRDSLNTVLMVSSLSIYKGVNQFFELANHFSSASLDFKIVLSATVDDFTTYAKAYNLLIPPNLSVICNPENLIENYLSADLLLNLTNRDMIVESYGLTLVEAISNGMPVMCPNIGGPKEILSDTEKCGWFVDEREIVNIISMLKYLRANPQALIEKSVYALEESHKYSKIEFVAKLKEYGFVKE